MEPKEMPRLTVRLEDIMRPPVHVTPDTPARQALKILLENEMPGVPVVDADGHLVGFVSDGHLLASALPKYLATMEDISFVRESGDAWVRYLAESADRPVGEVMSAEVSSVKSGTSGLAVAHNAHHDVASSVMVMGIGRHAQILNRLDI